MGEIGQDEGGNALKGSTASFLDALNDLGSPIASTPGSAMTEALFNGDAVSRPLACVTCANEGDVRRAVSVASAHNVPMAVLAGGHDLSNRAFRTGNLVLDVRPMSKVSVDTAACEVTFEGGTLTSDLVAALPDELVTVTGTVSSVGMTGLALGGGYGRLTSKYGLASDGLMRARVVLADGTVEIASDTDDDNLLWALRGGGGGFGVVTSMTMALHTLPKVPTAMIVIPLSYAQAAMLRYREMIDANPVDLSVFAGFMTAPSGDRVLFLAPLWCGEASVGEALLNQFAMLPGAQMLQQGWCSYRDTFDPEAEKAWPKGRYSLPTRTIRRIDEASAKILTEGAKRMPSPKSAIVLHDFHGVPTRVATAATAFALREDHVVVEVIGAWDPEESDDGELARAWAGHLSAELAMIALPGGYVNLLTPDEDERVRLFYGAAAARLTAIKRRLDSRDLFRSAIGRIAD